MNCGALERWLDEGMPGAGASAARAHASRCPLCGPRLDDAESLEALLAAPVATAPAGFTDRVLARIADEPGPRAVPSWLPAEPRPLPQWSRIGADPVLPIGLAVASVLLGLIHAAFTLASHPLPLVLPAIESGAIRAAMDGSPLRAAAVALALLPLVLLVSYALYRSIEGVVRTGLVRR